jgi:hypothetical protein
MDYSKSVIIRENPIERSIIDRKSSPFHSAGIISQVEKQTKK